MHVAQRSDRRVLVIAALVFGGSAAVTILWCRSMSSMPGMEMPGGWTMSMTWMRMPGQSWSGAAATFLGMWTVMMIAMMLPALLPMLFRYRKAVGHIGVREIDRQTMLVSAGYFFIWTLCGVPAFAVGLVLAEIAMRVPTLSRAVPVASGLIFMAAGLLQFAPWKARQLACCRHAPTRAMPLNAGTAWRHGIQLGLHCVLCCLGLTTLLLVIGVMDLRAMALVAGAISAERLASSGERVARGIGGTIITCGMALIALESGLPGK
ncbi:MAG TPA: DUF2182 domain-containing protein [Steroidobacteraceae bacterium]|nr:DUF2182 domain-containing protein [Steroidobacteraceae bacterium]